MDNSSGSSKKSGLLITLAIFLIIGLLGLFLYEFFFNRSKIEELTRSLQETKEEVQNVQKEAMEGKDATKDTARSELGDLKNAIKDVENPAVRLALVKAYAARLRTLLTASEQEDLDTVVLYIEKNPKVLFTPNPTLPANVQTAVNTLKTKLANAKSNSVATMQAIDEAIYSPGETATITGTIEYVGDDEVLEGSIFTLTDSETGYVYYLHFNNTNSETIQSTMLGKEVSITIRVTSKLNEPLTFQVVSGPTLATGPTQTTEPTTAPQTTTTP